MSNILDPDQDRHMSRQQKSLSKERAKNIKSKRYNLKLFLRACDVSLLSTGST